MSVNLSKCSPFHNLYSSTYTTNNWFTLYSVDGKGYLEKVVVLSGNPNYLRISIDGVVVTDIASHLNGGFYGVGFMTENCIRYTSGAYVSPIFYAATYSNFAHTVFKPYPYTSEGQFTIVIPTSLEFKKSLKIELKNDAAGAYLYANLSGGIL